MLGVALLDDHPATLDGLRALLSAEPDVVVASVLTAPALRRRLPILCPHVVVVAHRDGLAVCRDLKRGATAPAVILVTPGSGPAFALAARAAGADAILSETDSPLALLATIHAAAAGEATPPGFRRDGYAAAVERLEDDDLPVLTMLLDGRPPGAIAALLRLAPAELDVRVQRIVGRLQPVL
jgi:DNA-binding NarL/FixJ family response regulator